MNFSKLNRTSVWTVSSIVRLYITRTGTEWRVERKSNLRVNLKLDFEKKTLSICGMRQEKVVLQQRMKIYEYLCTTNGNNKAYVNLLYFNNERKNRRGKRTKAIKAKSIVINRGTSELEKSKMFFVRRWASSSGWLKFFTYLWNSRSFIFEIEVVPFLS